MEESPGSCIEKLRHNAVVHCAKDGCPNRKSDINQYCTKHQIWIFLDDTAALGKKACVNYVRGCREQLDTSYKFSRCEDCLKRDREKDKEKREAAKKKNLEKVNDSVKLCNTCCKELPIEEFNGLKGETLTCKTCRSSNKLNDQRRDRENRNKLARERVFVNYRKWARDRKINFNINREDFENIIRMNCYYCGILQDNGMNGVDRKDSSKEYNTDNCVSCCQMCNYIKLKDDVETFKKRIEHILTHNKRIEGRLFPEVFSNHKSVFYKSYKDRSEKKNREIMIDEKEFEILTSKDCYLCGKKSTNEHKNGIDRYDSSIGYEPSNCRPCCHSCNFMKSDYQYDDFINKLVTIYNYFF